MGSNGNILKDLEESVGVKKESVEMKSKCENIIDEI